MVMEEWSSQLIPETPCTLRLFLGALRQCIEVSFTFFGFFFPAHMGI